jgi:NAD-dependent deacetylase
MEQELMQKAITWLAAARSIAVLTGAGVSKESGIPTFRDALEGLWENYNPEELATPQGFQRNPKLVWQWYASRRQMLKQAQPNPAHYALARLAELKSVTLITQNVDGLHEKAGSKGVLELHGSLVRYKCFKGNHPIPLDLVEGAQEPPACPRCGSLARPDVVWFGEMLPLKTLQKAYQAASECDVMLVVGTSGLVHPAASLPLSALKAGAITIEVNPDHTALTRRLDIHLNGRAGSLMPTLVEGVAKALGA